MSRRRAFPQGVTSSSSSSSSPSLPPCLSSPPSSGKGGNAVIPVNGDEGEGEGAGARGSGDRGTAAAAEKEDRWSRMLPDLLGEISRRVDSTEEQWPLRRSVVSCACVCKRWREATLGIVRPPRESGKIIFPSALKQPGPTDSPLQCFIKRNKKNSTYYLYLSLTRSKNM